ncbi:hypothetical protein [Bartonella queenslandensis]|nr:hypothetical protein [Bartonella queenslandensis]
MSQENEGGGFYEVKEGEKVFLHVTEVLKLYRGAGEMMRIERKKFTAR